MYNMVSIEIFRYTDVSVVPLGLPDGSKWTVGCVDVLLCWTVRLIPVIPVISNASQEPCRYNAFLTRRQAAHCSAPLFLLSFSFTPSFAWQEGQKKEIHTFILSFFSFPPPRSWAFLPVGQHSRALFRVRTGSEMFNDGVSHTTFLLSFMRDRRGNLKCAIMCCCNLRTQFLNRIGLHTHIISTYQQTLTEVLVK